MGLDMHDFLLTKRGDLKEVVDSVIRLREYIGNRPETAATFKLRHVSGINQSIIRHTHIEFCGAWPLHERYGRGRADKYVIPQGRHSGRYTDVLAKCKCGTIISSISPGGNHQLADEHEHGTSCRQFDRLRAIADLKEMRYNEVFRLARMGWLLKDIAVRFNVGYKSMKMISHKYEKTFKELRDNYRRIAGNTYKHLVRVKRVSVDKVAEIYDVCPSTLHRWGRKFADELEEEVEYVNNKKGHFEWQRVGGASDD